MKKINPNKVANTLQKIGKTLLIISIPILIFGIVCLALSKKEDMTAYTVCSNCGKIELVVDKDGNLIKHTQSYDSNMNPVCDDCAESTTIAAVYSK